MTVTLDIPSLLTWSEAREVQTRFGPRLLSKGEPTPEFWLWWNQHKDELKAAGVSVGRNQAGDYEVCWWQQLDKNDLARRQANTELSRAAQSDFKAPCPEGLQFYPFQQAGIEFLLDKSAAYIADEMGLGKTIQAIGYINVIPEIETVLVVTKASLKENWRRELVKWLIRPMEIGIATGQHWPRTDCVIINYDVLSKHFHALRQHEWDLVILDESTNIKNPTAKRTLSVIGQTPSKKRQEQGEPIIPPIPAKRRLALSGTPIENRPQEIWTTLHYLDPQRWASFWSFARKYCGMVNNGFGVDCSGASNLDELQRILRSTLMIRRLKSDVLRELPPKTRMVIEMDTEGLEDVIAEDQKAYSRFEEDLTDAQVQVELARAADSDEAFKEAIRNMKGAQFMFAEMARVRHTTAVAKVPQLINLLKDELDECGGKLLVFGHHRDVLFPLHQAFPGSVMITGETPAEERQGICDIFQTDPRCKMFIGSIRACGEGLNLTAAKEVCFVEEDWAPGKVSQAEDRAHRIGQRDNVLVKHFILPGTIDAKMIKTTLEKQEVIDKALNEDPGEWATEPTFAPHKPLGRRREIQDEGLLMLRAEIEAVHIGLQMLADKCDGALALDRMGFNKVDTGIGHRLAEQSFLTPSQAALGRRLCRKYQGQLGTELIETMGVKSDSDTI